MVAGSELRHRGAGRSEASKPRPTSSTMHSGREAEKAFEMLNAVKKAEELPTSALDWWTPVFTIGSMALSIGNQISENVVAGVLDVGSGGLAFMTTTASTNKKFDLARLEREKIDLNVNLARLTGEKNEAAMAQNQAAMAQNQAAMQATMAQIHAEVLQLLRGLQQQVGQQQVGQPQPVGQQQGGQPQQVGQQQVGQLHRPAATIDRDILIIKNAILEVKFEIDTLLGKEPQPGAPNGYRDLAAAIV
ncbi:expressed unknown protein [Seminavis robusta]|uniref:Uncharacterized protein n=1 Tax=Seminavis robusta TaxID=568900 RepID=A0A9N8F0I0_9STRA|nr:expressed unknown protein [Seminavis robusta]|eukprot:Sro2411_g326710.1 n/a (247) ;mRNA; f:5644-6384